jgi:hypothetical protein
VIATSASAGSICGTVRDADTNQPVAQAAIFLYDDTDTYTGIHTATDISGMYCLLNVSPGTYTLQVRRDDYITEVVTGVEVTGTGTAVDVVAYPDLRIRVWPNPASDDIQFEIGSTDGTPVTLSVYDVKGRFVRGWKGVSSGGQTIGWNLRDLKGDPIASGVYFVRLQTARHRVTRRFVRFR